MTTPAQRAPTARYERAPVSGVFQLEAHFCRDACVFLDMTHIYPSNRVEMVSCVYRRR